MDHTPIYAKAYVEKADEEGRISVAVGSTSVIDRQGESIDQNGWDLTNFQKNSPLLWAHNAYEAKPPIGVVERVWFEGEGKNRVMKFTPRFDLEDDFAKLVYSKYQRGFLNAFSVGFIPREKDGDTFTKQELLEISAVPIPANPEALVEVKGLGVTDWKALTTQNIVGESEVEEEVAEEVEETDEVIEEPVEEVEEAVEEEKQAPVVQVVAVDELMSSIKSIVRKEMRASKKRTEKDITGDLQKALQIAVTATNKALEKLNKGGDN